MKSDTLKGSSAVIIWLGQLADIPYDMMDERFMQEVLDFL